MSNDYLTGNELIEIEQLPVIREQLQAVKDRWMERVGRAKAAECTEETIHSVKKERAEMRKEFEEYSQRFKAIKAVYMEPWKRVEEVFKVCIEDSFNEADGIYKDKVGEIEGVQKRSCEEKCLEYFNELAEANNIPFINFNDLGIKVTLSEAKKKTPSKYFEQIRNFIEKVSDEIRSISEMPDGAEIAAEYKQNGYNLARAVRTVQDRKRMAEAEQKRLDSLKKADEKEAERIAEIEKVETAAVPEAPVVVPIVDEVATENIFRFWTTPAQFEAIKPELKMLVAAFKREGIKY